MKLNFVWTNTKKEGGDAVPPTKGRMAAAPQSRGGRKHPRRRRETAPLKGGTQHHTRREKEDSSTNALKKGRENSTSPKGGGGEGTTTRKGREGKQHQLEEGEGRSLLWVVLPVPSSLECVASHPSSLSDGATYSARSFGWRCSSPLLRVALLFSLGRCGFPSSLLFG